MASIPRCAGRVFSRSDFIALAKTGAAPSVPIAIVTGSRSTIAGVINWLSFKLSTMLINAPSSRAILALLASSILSSLAP